MPADLAGSPTEQFVGRTTQALLPTVQKYYGPVRSGSLLASLFVTLGIAPLLLGREQEPGHGHSECCEPAAHDALLFFRMVILFIVLARVSTLAFQWRAKTATAGLLAEPGSAARGPGQLVAGVYQRTWSQYSSASLVFASLFTAVGVGLVWLVARQPDPWPGGLIALIFPAAGAASVWLLLKQRRTQQANARRGLQADAAPGSPGGRAHAQFVAAATDGFAAEGTPDIATETVRYWAAPIMRVHTKGAHYQFTVGARAERAGVRRVGAEHHAVHRPSPVPAVRAPPGAAGSRQRPGQLRPGEDGPVRRGTSVRAEVAQQLQTRGLAAMVERRLAEHQDPATERPALLMDGCRFVIATPHGPIDTFVVDHADAAARLAADLQRLAIPVYSGQRA